METATFQSTSIQLPKELLANPSLLKVVVTESWAQMTIDEQNQFINLLPSGTNSASSPQLFSSKLESGYFKGGDPFESFAKLNNEKYFTKV
jgi:hypothetical protein